MAKAGGMAASSAIRRGAHLIAAKGQRVQGEAVAPPSLQRLRPYFLPRLLLC